MKIFCFINISFIAMGSFVVYNGGELTKVVESENIKEGNDG